MGTVGVACVFRTVALVSTAWINLNLGVPTLRSSAVYHQSPTLVTCCSPPQIPEV